MCVLPLLLRSNNDDAGWSVCREGPINLNEDTKLVIRAARPTLLTEGGFHIRTQDETTPTKLMKYIAKHT